jgi:hypothetical protein
MNRAGGYIDVDELQAKTTLEEAAAICGVRIDPHGSGSEKRIDCPFSCDGDHVGRRELAINVANAQKVFQCYAYSCGFRGNLLTLMHGWTAGTKPSGGKLKGDEFQRVKKILAGQKTIKNRMVDPGDAAQTESESKDRAPTRNIALIDSADPKIRELHNIDEKFVVDVATMNPAAAAYIRRHPCLTPESMKKWRCGYLPNDGGGDKRGWSLRGSIVYPALSDDCGPEKKSIACLGQIVSCLVTSHV